MEVISPHEMVSAGPRDEGKAERIVFERRGGLQVAILGKTHFMYRLYSLLLD